MFQRKPRRFRRRPNGRNSGPHNNSQNRQRPNAFSNGHSRNNFRNSLLIAVDNNQVIDLSAMTIDRDCEITLFPPIAGG